MKVVVPGAVGAPLMVPAPLKDSPAGRAERLVQLYGGVPPMAVSVALYWAFTRLLGRDVVLTSSWPDCSLPTLKNVAGED